MTHVLLTHGHNDHIGDALPILQKTGAMLVANFEICMFLVGKGANDKKINPGNHGGTVDCGGFTTTFVQALHSSSFGGEGGATNLNPRYTFANFIVGSANRLGHAASLSVAERQIEPRPDVLWIVFEGAFECSPRLGGDGALVGARNGLAEVALRRRVAAEKPGDVAEGFGCLLVPAQPDVDRRQHLPAAGVVGIGLKVRLDPRQQNRHVLLIRRGG